MRQRRSNCVAGVNQKRSRHKAKRNESHRARSVDHISEVKALRLREVQVRAVKQTSNQVTKQVLSRILSQFRKNSIEAESEFNEALSKTIRHGRLSAQNALVSLADEGWVRVEADQQASVARIDIGGLRNWPLLLIGRTLRLGVPFGRKVRQT